MNKYWAQHFPENRIYSGFDAEVISSILEEQMGKYEKIAMGEFKDENGNPKIPYVVMVNNSLFLTMLFVINTTNTDI
jgi:hypothetical protein